jgi:hypothetical protein
LYRRLEPGALNSGMSVLVDRDRRDWQGGGADGMAHGACAPHRAPGQSLRYPRERMRAALRRPMRLKCSVPKRWSVVWPPIRPIAAKYSGPRRSRSEVPPLRPMRRKKALPYRLRTENPPFFACGTPGRGPALRLGSSCVRCDVGVAPPARAEVDVSPGCVGASEDGVTAASPFLVLDGACGVVAGALCAGCAGCICLSCVSLLCVSPVCLSCANASLLYSERQLGTLTLGSC